jgi:hypothetical protein
MGLDCIAKIEDGSPRTCTVSNPSCRRSSRSSWCSQLQSRSVHLLCAVGCAIEQRHTSTSSTENPLVPANYTGQSLRTQQLTRIPTSHQAHHHHQPAVQHLHFYYSPPLTYRPVAEHWYLNPLFCPSSVVKVQQPRLGDFGPNPT